MAGNRRNRLPIQGKRSKVEIDDSAGKDKSINGFFESAISPEEKKDDNEGRERALMPSNNDLSPPLSPERGMEKQPARAPQENVRLSLLGQKHDSFETGVEEDRHVGAPRISKWTSPSDLSRVSTLPPTPGAGLQKQAEIAEDVELLRHAGAEDELHENPMVEEPEDFPQPDDDDDGDDLAPPIMDDDDDESRAEEQGTEEHLQAEKKLSDTESENNDEDGEKEAAGIELAPEDDENEMVEEEEEEEEEDTLSEDGSSAGEWVTPENLHRFGVGVEPDAGVRVTCATADYSVQNVLLQMGITPMTFDGYAVRSVKMWGLVCRACFFFTRESQKVFCPKCGHDTLVRVPIVVDAEGRPVALNQGRRLRRKGTVFSMPKPEGGRGWKPILAEDEMKIGGRDREQRRLENLYSKERMARDPFNEDNGARGWYQRGTTNTGKVLVGGAPRIHAGWGRRNPNANNFGGFRGQKKR
mmetsp:Transcript_114396/g.330524  ORF Transcript_114396/g.330524 Transcript_114396/m.330524 type:complete len:470 (-) Transcript_114396:131-1540(-)